MSDPRILKPYAAHGWIAMRTIYARGGVFTYIVTDPDNFPLHLYTKGRIDIYDIDTNELRSERAPGFWSQGKEDFSKDKWKLVVEENSEVWCFDPGVNKGVKPPVTLFSLAANSVQNVTPANKLFLCEGTFIVGSKEVTGPKQVTFSSNCELQAKSDCYGVFIE